MAKYIHVATVINIETGEKKRAGTRHFSSRKKAIQSMSTHMKYVLKDEVRHVEDSYTTFAEIRGNEWRVHIERELLF